MARGYIRKRGGGSYSLCISLGKDAVSGKYRQQWVSVKGTKKEAEARLADLLHQLDTGTYMRPGRTTVGEFLDQWLKDYAASNLAPRTVEGYESIIRCHLMPALGNIPLNQLRAEHLQHYYSGKLSAGRYDGKGPLTRRTVLHHHTCLHRALEMALKWGLINRNPADAVIPPRPQRTEMHTLDEIDLNRFLQAAKGTPYHVIFYLALFTGLRRSELLALRWSDISLPTAEIHVTRSIHQLRTGEMVFRETKTAKSRRMVSLSPSTALLLQEYRDERAGQCAMVGTILRDDDLVFTKLEGKPFRPNTVSRAWTMLATRCGLKAIRFHDARHTHASLMLKQGVHPKIVQERLGHATMATTLDTYSHVAPGLQEAAARGFDEMVLPKKRVN